jgi:hypothetical protein
MAAIDRLRQRLRELGATRTGADDGGAFREETYSLGRVLLRLTSEYGAWRATLALASEPFFPASFWIAALDGEPVFPDPPVTDEDVARVADRLPELVQRAPDVSPAVAAMGAEYSRAMRDRFT